ncbi:MFS transporter [Caldanaerobacter subterraneus]|nr:Na+/melibiose symporter [Caldanaerobacter subterraneus subsp. pacificus DSM 12653]
MLFSVRFLRKEINMTTLKKVAYSFGNFPIGIMLEAFGTYVMFFYIDVLKVDPSFISLAFVIHGIIFAIFNPLIGYVSDKTETRWGRRRPYIAFGIVPLALVFYVIWSPFVSKEFLPAYFLTVIILFDFLYVLVGLNLAALFPEMFPSLEERAQVSAYRQMFGILGSIIGVVLPPIIYSRYGWNVLGIIFGTLIAIGFFIAFYGCEEKKNIKIPSIPVLTAFKYVFLNKAFLPFVVGGFFAKFLLTSVPAAIPFFTKYVLRIPEKEVSLLLGSIFVTAIPMMLVWSKITKKFGSRKAMFLSIGFLILVFPAYFFVNTFVETLIVSVIFGALLAGVVMLLDVMLAEVIDEDTKNTGMKREGMYTGVFGFIIRFGYSLQGIVIGGILKLSGYIPNVLEQPSSAILGIRFLISGVPVIALLIAFISFWFYPIGRKENA